MEMIRASALAWMTGEGTTSGLTRARDWTASLVASALRFGTGSFVGQIGARPAGRLTLFDDERCPDCRRVREVLSTLDLDVDIRPCPRGGKRFRDDLRRVAGESHPPCLVDHAESRVVYGADAIVVHLCERYGTGSVPWGHRLGPISRMTGRLATGGRSTPSVALPSVRPGLPLDLWGYEGAAECRRVRDVLCTYEMPFTLHNVARGSAKRRALLRPGSAGRIPCLVDLNTGAVLADSCAIASYVRRIYGEARAARDPKVAAARDAHTSEPPHAARHAWVRSGGAASAAT